MRNDAPSTSHYAFTPDGQIVGYYGRAFRQELSKDNKDNKDNKDKTDPSLRAAENKTKNKKVANNRNIHIPRQELRQLLLDRLKPDTIVWGKKFKSFENEDESIMVHFESGESIQAELLIGADGIYSGVSFKPNPEPRPDRTL